MTRLTAVLTALFFVTSLTLAVFAKKQSQTVYTLPGAEQVQTPTPSESSTNAPVKTQ